jgi:hypothetical protein
VLAAALTTSTAFRNFTFISRQLCQRQQQHGVVASLRRSLHRVRVKDLVVCELFTADAAAHRTRSLWEDLVLVKLGDCFKPQGQR